MWQCLEGRQQDARHIRESRQGRREKGRTRRLAHRSREQNTLRKLLVASEAALKMQGGNREMLGVEIVCLRQLDMNDLAEQWSRGHLGRLVNTPEWKRAVKCLGAWQRASLEALTSNLCFSTFGAQHSSHTESFSSLLTVCAVHWQHTTLPDASVHPPEQFPTMHIEHIVSSCFESDVFVSTFSC